MSTQTPRSSTPLAWGNPLNEKTASGTPRGGFVSNAYANTCQLTETGMDACVAGVALPYGLKHGEGQ